MSAHKADTGEKANATTAAHALVRSVRAKREVQGDKFILRATLLIRGQCQPEAELGIGNVWGRSDARGGSAYVSLIEKPAPRAAAHHAARARDRAGRIGFR